MKYINKFLVPFKRKSNISSFKNILVVSNTGVGDTVLASPAIKTLRKSFPNIHITFLINKKMYPLFEGFEYVDDFLLFSTGFFNQFLLIKELRKKQIDTIFLFHSNGPGDIFFSILSGANNILKMTGNINHEFKSIFLNKLEDKYQHIIEEKIDLVRIFNPRIIDTVMELPKKFSIKNDILNKNSDFKYIGLQLATQDLYKIWPIENFIELTKKILDNYKCKIILFGANDFEKELASKLDYALSSNKNIVNLSGKTSIDSLPFYLKELDLLVTNDTGTMHIAIALDTPTISLFSPTDSKIFGPYQRFDIHKVIQKDGYFINNVPKKKRSQEAMKLISVEEVFESAKKVFND
jgi:ADP-heptose:LPS heptosyltransferase